MKVADINELVEEWVASQFNIGKSIVSTVKVNPISNCVDTHIVEFLQSEINREVEALELGNLISAEANKLISSTMVQVRESRVIDLYGDFVDTFRATFAYESANVSLNITNQIIKTVIEKLNAPE